MSNFFGIDSLKRNLDKLVTDRFNGGSLGLFNTNITPANADVAATYTAHECVFGGYARITLNAWVAAVENGSGNAEIVETVRTFTATGTSLPDTIYGIFVLDAAGNLAYAEKIPTGAVTLSAAGHSFSYQPIVDSQRL